MTKPLEQIGMIGDGETVALITQQGSVDWLCLPRFDSPACCAALIGTDANGCWSITPQEPLERSAHRYQSDTMILETDLTSASGTIRITDFMPIRAGNPVLVRIVTGLKGRVPTRMDAALRFDYGNMPPWVTPSPDGTTMHVGPDRVTIRSSEKLVSAQSTVSATFTVSETSRHVFVLTYSDAKDADPEPIDPEKALKETQRFWRDWIEPFQNPGTKEAYGEALRRSLLTLKALVHRPTGGLVAAPTTSLPEQPGGTMNWDYRFCWLRDATFTLSALVDCGFTQEASAWRDWILRAVAGAPEKMQIMYRVDGSRRLDESELDWLQGYRFARPVRVGNAAAGQLQLDVYGELIRVLHASHEAGMERTEQGRHIEHAIVDYVERIWEKPDAGLWESRGTPRHYTYSKVMTWAALDLFLKGAGGKELPEEERQRIEALRDEIHAVICKEGYDNGLGSFTSFFGGQEVDASLLLLPKVGFLPVDDERMRGTIARIEDQLVEDGLVRRHRMNDLVPEGAFLACSFWLAECQLLQGRRSDAERTIERVLSVRSDLGLLSEEYDLPSKRLAGNFPQALSHLALVNALMALAKFDESSDLGSRGNG